MALGSFSRRVRDFWVGVGFTDDESGSGFLRFLPRFLGSHRWQLACNACLTHREHGIPPSHLTLERRQLLHAGFGNPDFFPASTDPAAKEGGNGATAGTTSVFSGWDGAQRATISHLVTTAGW